MKLTRALLLSIPVVGALALHVSDAAACGACVPPEGESSQVTGHRMLLSVSQAGTTLWDQIEYSGEPSSFAWVLPIKGQVDIGLSSDLVFAALSDSTRTYVAPPPLNCPPPPWCWGWGEDGAGTGSGGGGGASGGVDVIAQEVIGPYETVQLASNDPGALKNWLISHGYKIDVNSAPVIDAYVNEGFDFLAMKLVPGAGVNSMRPVRVTAPGAGDTLPLRMVAVGTGAITPITLWVFGEGRYEPTNFPSFTIDPTQVVWNWDTSDSNYTTLKADGFAAGGNGNWLVQHAQPTSPWNLRSTLEQVVQVLPDQSGYGDPADGWATAWDELQEDLSMMFDGINENALWVTRLNGEIARQHLNQDLKFGASMSQEPVSSYIQTLQAVGTPPTCPVYPPCDDPNNGNGSSSGGTWWNNLGDGNGSTAKGGCAVGGSGDAPSAIALIGIGLSLSLIRRRKR